MNHNPSDLTFEQALQELEKTVEQLKSGELSLEQIVTRFEYGKVLTNYCSDLMKKAGPHLHLNPSEIPYYHMAPD